MLLSIEQAATRLGKSARQIRYLIQSKRLPAQKMAGRWLIDAADLPLSADQHKALERKERQMRSVVEQGLGLPEESKRAPRYSVRDLKAFQIALPIQRRAGALSTTSPGTCARRTGTGTSPRTRTGTSVFAVYAARAANMPPQRCHAGFGRGMVPETPARPFQ